MWLKSRPDRGRLKSAVLVAGLAALSAGSAWGFARPADTTRTGPDSSKAAAVAAVRPGAAAPDSAGRQSVSPDTAGRESVEPDSAGLFARTAPRKTETKSPRGALIRSAVLPGWGQWYNGAKWKTGLVAAAAAGLAANIIIQNRRAADSVTEDERAFYENSRNLTWWWVAGLYGLTLADAYVDAHLWHFDTGPEPGWGAFGGGVTGVRLSVSF
ncbi:hypothetical protein JW777_04685 [bacterium]|nr:hypothetical protein [bacterium]